MMWEFWYLNTMTCKLILFVTKWQFDLTFVTIHWTVWLFKDIDDRCLRWVWYETRRDAQELKRYSQSNWDNWIRFGSIRRNSDFYLRIFIVGIWSQLVLESSKDLVSNSDKILCQFTSFLFHKQSSDQDFLWLFW